MLGTFFARAFQVLPRLSDLDHVSNESGIRRTVAWIVSTLDQSPMNPGVPVTEIPVVLPPVWRSGAMPKLRERFTPDNSYTIPAVTCPHCARAMRLFMMAPAAIAVTRKDTLIFQCACGHREDRPVADE